MLTPATRLRLQGILQRIGNDQPVSLQDRIYVQKFADRDQGVAGWLRQARRQRTVTSGDHRMGDGIDRFLDALNLGSTDPDDRFNPGDDDIEGWFGGAPGWLRRS